MVGAGGAQGFVRTVSGADGNAEANAGGAAGLHIEIVVADDDGVIGDAAEGGDGAEDVVGVGLGEGDVVAGEEDGVAAVAGPQDALGGVPAVARDEGDAEVAPPEKEKPAAKEEPGRTRPSRVDDSRTITVAALSGSAAARIFARTRRSVTWSNSSPRQSDWRSPSDDGPERTPECPEPDNPS